MINFYDELSKVSIISFCEFTDPRDECFTFTPKQGFHENHKKEVYQIKKTNNGYIITDVGITYENLDHLFELSEPDVTKNIIAIINQTNVKWIGREFIYEIDPEKKLSSQIFSYLQGINFIYAMKVFYV